MRVELKIDAKCEEPYVEIHTAKLTPNIQAAISLLQSENDTYILTAQHDNKTYMMDPETIVVICTEGRELVLYDVAKTRYIVNKPLYELEAQLGKDFIRISKSAIINIRKIKHIEAAFNGTMEVELVMGIKEVITRNYRKKFKERLGV
ncbi:LytTR family DNA-binding domain-containing protein [Lysinibacillus sp. KU-BSD001]|uniref:LytTR family DNA-binding domain-containing protein n=1 Tax=Lysinibacillus sp. KU-BSD001 TaxID=3141328 RepID=UPI0036E0D05D